MTRGHSIERTASGGPRCRGRRLIALTLWAAAGVLTAKASEAQASAAPAQGTANRALIVRGDSIFHGMGVAAICVTCHGPKAKGVPGLGPDLTDAAWLHGNGSLEFLRNLVRTGVPQPKKSSTIMPPFGGTPLDSAQVTALAEYVLSLSAKAARK